MFLVLPLIGKAGSFEVSPIILNLSAQQQIGTFTIYNSSDQSTVVQLSLRQWSQKNMQDNYAPTIDLIVTPPIIRIAGNSSQLIRVGLLHPVNNQQELAYRLYAQEVPKPPAPGFKGLQIALRISVPVFITPVTTVNSQLIWQAKRLSGNTLQIKLINTGNVHTKISQLTFINPITKQTWSDQTEFTYVLPGQYYVWTIKGKNVYPADLNNVELTALTDQGKKNFSVTIN